MLNSAYLLTELTTYWCCPDMTEMIIINTMIIFAQ